MLVIGLTGGIAQGKTNVANMLSSRGFSVLFADQIAHRSYEPGTKCFDKLVEAFGADVVGDDGFVNRKVLGSKVFGNREALDKLNDIVWPATADLIVRELVRHREGGVKTVFVEAAVLFAAEWDTMCNQVWLVSAAPDVQLARLMARNNLSREDALKRINSQMSEEERRARSSVVIENNGTLAELEEAVSAAVAKAKLVAGTLTSKPSEEVVWHVDEMNNVIGSVPRSRVRAENLWHRATYILVENSKRQLYVQVRTLQKDYCPGYLDAVTGGIVAAGEEYDVSAQRELAEELGVTGVPLQFLFNFPYQDTVSKVWGGGFYCMYDGPITPQESEVQRVEMMTLEDVDKAVSDGTKFTPDSLHFLQLYKQYVEAKGDPARYSPLFKGPSATATPTPAAALSRSRTFPSRKVLGAVAVAAVATTALVTYLRRRSQR